MKKFFTLSLGILGALGVQQIAAQKPVTVMPVAPAPDGGGFTPTGKPNFVGTFPKIKNAKPWNGLKAGSYSIKVKLNGAKNEEIYLADHYWDGKYLRDTAMCDANGYAVFSSDKFQLQRGMYLVVAPQKRGFFEIIIDDDQDFYIETDTAYYSGEYFKNMKVKGSESNEAFAKYQKEKYRYSFEIYEIDQRMKVDTLEPNLSKLKAERRELFRKKNEQDSIYMSKFPNHYLTKFLSAMRDIDVPTELPTKPNGTKDSMYPALFYKKHYWDNIDFAEDGLLRSPVHFMKEKVDYYFENLVSPDADSIIKEIDQLISKAKDGVEVERFLIMYGMTKFETSKIMGHDAVVVHMGIKYYAGGYAWWLDSSTLTQIVENCMRRWYTIIGKTAPELMLHDSADRWVKPLDIKADYKFLVFWDPTCSHCREVVPKLAKIVSENPDKNWKVVSLSVHDRKREWKEYLREHPEISSWTNLIREVPNEFYRNNLYYYYIIQNPTIFILDKNNKIVANKIDVEKAAEFLKHYDSVMKNKAAQ